MTRHPPQRRIDRQLQHHNDWRSRRVSAHFTLGEFFTHPSPPPPPDQVRACRDLAVYVLEPLRSRFGAGVIVSGHRTEAQNKAVGGAPNSYHVYEDHPQHAAVDIVFRSGSPSAWGAAAATGRAGGIGVYAAHVHLDNRDQRVTWRSESG